MRLTTRAISPAQTGPCASATASSAAGATSASLRPSCRRARRVPSNRRHPRPVAHRARARAAPAATERRVDDHRTDAGADQHVDEALEPVTSAHVGLGERRGSHIGLHECRGDGAQPSMRRPRRASPSWRSSGSLPAVDDLRHRRADVVDRVGSSPVRRRCRDTPPGWSFPCSVSAPRPANDPPGVEFDDAAGDCQYGRVRFRSRTRATRG